MRRRCFGQRFYLRPLRLTPPRWGRSTGNTHRPGHSKPALLHRVRGGASARCSFLHVMRDACCCFERTRSGSACATSANSCPADSTRAALPKTKGTRGPQMSKLRIHACHRRREWLFDYMGLLRRKQHHKPLRQGSICVWACAVACVPCVTTATKRYVCLGREYALVSF